MSVASNMTTPNALASRHDSTWAEDAALAGISVWIVTAVHLDGRAHFMEVPDSFFTWWHLLMYSGLGVAILALAAMGLRRREPRQSLLAATLRPPPGYGWSVAGGAVFFVGGVGDLLWHSVFGIESGIDALLSPTHLVLFSGAVLLFSGPLFATIAKSRDGVRWPVPALISVGAIAAAAGFALSYVSAFTTDAPLRQVEKLPEGTPEHYATEVPAIAGLGSFVLTSLVLVLPLLFLLSRRRVPFGIVTVGVAALATLAQLVHDFERPWMILAASVGGLVVDLLVAALSPRMSAAAVAIVVATTLPLAVWSALLIALQLSEGVRWSAELAAGSVLLGAMISVLVVTAGGFADRRSTEPRTADRHPERCARMSHAVS